MISPLKDLPLNTLRVYVRGITQTGCQIYVPIDSEIPKIHQLTKRDLQAYLDNQVMPEIEPEPLLG